MESKKKYERFRYTPEALEKALQSIINGETTLNKASKYYNIPKSTLHNKLTNKVPRERKMGPATELTSNEEAELAEWILNKAKLGFPMHPDDVVDTVESFLNANNRVSKFTENRPGDKWLQLFLKRHPDVTKRNSELISKARAAVTEEGIRKWFLELEEYLIEENAIDIINDPSRIFNSDETGVLLCPKTGLILGPKNYKNTYQIAHGKEKESVTVLCTFSADGNNVPPFVVYPYKRMPPAVAKEFPDTWFIGRSDSGWMVSATFFAYIKLYHEWLLENKIKFPVILFLDGHKSHINREMTTFCKEKRILLFCLHPNATHILQPCDVGIFGPIKKFWKKVVRKHKQATTAPVTKQNFAPIFKKAYDNAVKPETIKNSFRACGLFPVNADAVDYSKCINTRRQEIAEKTRQNNMLTDFDEQKDDMRSTMKVIENEIDQITRLEFLKYYQIKKSYVHPLFDLWAKCKATLENDPNRYQNRVEKENVLPEVPLDLSNSSTVEVTSQRASTATLVVNDSNSGDENPNIETIETVVQIHEHANSNAIEKDNEDLTATCTPILNDTDLFGEKTTYDFDKTDDIIDYIVDHDTSLPLLVTIPPHHKTMEIDAVTDGAYCNTQKGDNTAESNFSPSKPPTVSQTSAKSVSNMDMSNSSVTVIPDVLEIGSINTDSQNSKISLDLDAITMTRNRNSENDIDILVKPHIEPQTFVKPVCFAPLMPVSADSDDENMFLIKKSKESNNLNNIMFNSLGVNLDSNANTDIPIIDADSNVLNLNDSTLATTPIPSSADTNTKTQEKKRKIVPLNDFMHYPEITKKKTKTVMKKEPVPFGLTGRKCKEYFEKQDEEKRRKEVEIERKRKKRSEEIQTRKSKAIEKKKTQQKKKQLNDDNKITENHTEKVKIQDPKSGKVKEIQPKNKQNNEINLTNQKASELHKPADIYNINTGTKENEEICLVHDNYVELCGKYVIVGFKTEKRVRYFVGKVLMYNDEQKKYKVDFLRKRSVAENIVTFVKPQISDVSEINFSDVDRVLTDPSISRRGFVSFSDVSFKDIE